MQERLQKILANEGYGSRRTCEAFIKEGRVTVNGVIITELGSKADPETDEIYFDGKPIEFVRRVYILLNKPSGIMTTRSDPHAEKIVMDLVRGIKESIYPVGRLDVDTVGALLLMNDGELAKRLTHPKYNISKEYKAKIKGIISDEAVQQLKNGVYLFDEANPKKGWTTAPSVVKSVKRFPNGNCTIITIAIHEGKKHQIKRMFKAVGYPVQSLQRLSFAGISVGDLPEGKYRTLTRKEVEGLYKLCGLL